VGSALADGIAEAFVKACKRDHVRVNPIPDAATALTAVGKWMADHDEVHPHSRPGCRSPSAYRRAIAQPVACPARQEKLHLDSIREADAPADDGVGTSQVE
jgi:hypothetical protein